MDNFDSEGFRGGLARELQGRPKRERRAILETAKGSPDYWQARGIKINEREHEEEVDNGLGILLKKKTIYRGSGTSGIRQFGKAEEDTVGSGVYFTSEAKDAIGYARRRSRGKEGATPVIYESLVENMRLLDLRKDENVRKVLEGFKEVLQDKLQEPGLKWNYERVLQDAVRTINEGGVSVGNLRDVTFGTGKMFTGYVKTLGYGGLVTLEGGEGDDVGDHDTYLIFDPEKVKINQEHKIL